MTISTPVIIESEDVPLVNILQAFEKSSLFGLDCLFKINQSYVKNSYYPTLSSIYIENLNANKNNPNLSTSLISNVGGCGNLMNDNSTLDGSFFSNASAQEDNPINFNLNLTTSSTIRGDRDLHSFQRAKNVINVHEDKPLHHKPCISVKLEEIAKSNQDFEDLTLGDVSEDSWFSILWTPSKSSFSGYKNSINYSNNISFLVFYKFRNKVITNSAHFMQVIGLITNKIDDEVFWFSNQAVNCKMNTYKEDFFNNKYNFQTFVENVERFVNYNKISGNIDYTLMTKY